MAQKPGRRPRTAAQPAATTNVAVVAAVAAALPAAVFLLLPRSDEAAEQVHAADLLALLRTGNCSDANIPTLDLALLPESERRPLVGVQCPAVLLGVGARAGVEDELTQWRSWPRLRSAFHSDSTITYDEHVEPRLTYWDNQTALAAAVRARGFARQGYIKVTGRPSSFMRRVARAADSGGGRARAAPYVRYGADFASFSSAASRRLGVSERPPDGAGAGREAGRLAAISPAAALEGTKVGLWISSAGMMSTWHYDRWDNSHVVVAGEKRVRLAAPSLSAFAAAGIRPNTHPHGRQARHEPTRPLAVTLHAGQGIFIPAAWLHELEATGGAAAAAISVTSRPRELTDARARPAALPPCCPAALLPCRPASLPPCCPAALLPRELTDAPARGRSTIAAPAHGTSAPPDVRAGEADM